ncbi:hypothetical protein ACFJIX_21155 [Roseateles sp. UC29_93]|uniref:hypothetical protein n=1 Tax=Roseateles sp. UC29_93 TaxID=3350177 RepID=UPI00366FBA34
MAPPTASMPGCARRVGNLQTLQVGRQPLSAQDVHFAAAKDSPLAAWLPRIDSAIGARRKEIQRLVNLGDG